MPDMFRRRAILDVAIIIGMSLLLFYGVSWQLFTWYADPAKYECYAVAFWHGVTALKTLQVPAIQCNFIAQPSASSPDALVTFLQLHNAPTWLISFVLAQSPTQPLHALPHEYPLLTLIPFSIGLLVTPHWSQVAFAIGMEGVVTAVYLTLRVCRSQRAAIAFALYIVVGCWSTAVARFDMLPAGITLGALLLAQRRQWRWAYALLALATLLKFYPIVLVPAFLIAQYRTSHIVWYRLWRGLDAFVLVCISITFVSLLLSIEGTLDPLGYFGYRPVQVESTAASLLWLASFVGFPLHYSTTFGSLNMLSSLSGIVSPLFTLAFLVVLLYTYWLQWSGKVQLPLALVLILLVVICLGKVFSPQYLLWILPFVAYVGEWNKWWLISWTAIGMLTTWIFPYIYLMSHSLILVPNIPIFNPAVLVRNVLLLVVLAMLLVHYTKQSEKGSFLAENVAQKPRSSANTAIAQAD